jgi:hypothetical protein
MPDLKDPRLMYLKAGLFLLIGLLACAGILLEAPSMRVALLLAAAIWAFCRLYYFLFYVIERYIDPQARFGGVWDAVKHLARRTAKNE